MCCPTAPAHSSPVSLSQAGAYIDTHCPGTGAVSAKVPDSDADDMEAAVCAAEAAFPAWAAVGVAERARMLNRIADTLERRLPEFARAESHDQGCNIKFASEVRQRTELASVRSNTCSSPRLRPCPVCLS